MRENLVREAGPNGYVSFVDRRRFEAKARYVESDVHVGWNYYDDPANACACILQINTYKILFLVATNYP